MYRLSGRIRRGLLFKENPFHLMLTKEKVVNYWKKSAQKDRRVVKDMLNSKHNDWALFVWHLTIEKLLKGLLVKGEREVIFTHNLFRLATELEKLNFPDKYLDWLKEITTFNLEARYSSYKFEFYKKATDGYTKKWDSRCEEIYQWLLKKF